MGIVKAEMARTEQLEAQATGILIRTGALSECESHDGILINNNNPDAVTRAYAIGTNMVKNGEVDGSRSEFMDAIKTASESGADECYLCMKHRDD